MKFILPTRTTADIRPIRGQPGKFVLVYTERNANTARNRKITADTKRVFNERLAPMIRQFPGMDHVSVRTRQATTTLTIRGSRSGVALYLFSEFAGWVAPDHMTKIMTMTPGFKEMTKIMTMTPGFKEILNGRVPTMHEDTKDLEQQYTGDKHSTLRVGLTAAELASLSVSPHNPPSQKREKR